MQKYLIGKRFIVAGQEFRIENGTFEIIKHLPQADGDDYYIYRRVGSDDGNLINDKSRYNQRGNFASNLDRMATII